MDFTPDETQRSISQLAADVLRGELTQERTPGRHGYDEHLWQALGKADLLGLSVPSELGGDDLGVAEVGAVLTEIGRYAAPLPAVATLACGALPVGAFGTARHRQQLLPAVASGESLVTAALHEPSALWTTEPTTTATKSAGQWRLDGRKTSVAFAAESTRVIVPATTPDGVELFLVSPDAKGVTLRSSPNSAATPEHTVILDGVLLDEDERMASHTGTVALQQLHRFALAGLCAVADGALAAVLELTTTHLGTRHQFGKALASFQSASSQVADIYIAARTLHLATSSAIWRLSEGMDAEQDLGVAGYWLATEAPPALANAHHLHGGVGVDETYPLHHYYALIKDLARLAGGTRARTRSLAQAIGGA